MKNERLEQLYELHTTYNKHEDKPICKFIELLKEKRFSLLNLKDHSLWNLYILMFGKLIIEDKDLAPTEKDKKALEDIILEKDEKGFNGVSIKEDLYREDINTFLQQAILYKGEIYKIK